MLQHQPARSSPVVQSVADRASVRAMVQRTVGPKQSHSILNAAPHGSTECGNDISMFHLQSYKYLTLWELEARKGDCDYTPFCKAFRRQGRTVMTEAFSQTFRTICVNADKRGRPP